MKREQEKFFRIKGDVKNLWDVWQKVYWATNRLEVSESDGL